ncbi:phage tail tape measure protein [Spirosoma rhododendri]|uniref:Phage tail tape measure protein n=1 Tax=Spirosoma rhododendri TaxID=2728024 RepID=A0A7L5DSM0_9BACT|nr:hypothetical protein [Spirosoma rhododendri]QJD79568.1 hypothetical protein HH216_14955 [Spirosoma rhododendri]
MARTQNERAIIDLVINGQQAKTSLKEVSLSITKMRSELNKMHEADDPALYAAKVREINKMIAAQREMTARINDTSTAWGRFKKEMATVATGVVGGNVITFMLQSLVNLIPQTIDRTMKLKDSFADIEKATGLSSEGVKRLNKELKDIDTRTTNQDLRDIAVAAGQLGVANDQLVSFVKNADMAVVALGDEFSGGVEQVAKELGGIAKLYKETQAMDTGEALSRIGSGLNELGAAGSATAPVVAEFVQRMGQLGNLAPSLAQTAGYGAALQELGMTAEIAASGLGKILMTGATKSDLFAQHLGKTKEEVEALINTNPDQFLKALALSFQGLSQTQVVQRMKELKLESDESIKVMSLLANQTDFVTKKQEIMASAFAENTSLAKEFEKKNYDLAKELKNLTEWFNGLFTSEGLQNFLAEAVHNTLEFTKSLSTAKRWFGENSVALYALATAAVAYNGATLAAVAATALDTLHQGYRKVAYELGFRWLVLQSSASTAYATVTGLLTGQITLQTAAVTLARTAWAAFNAVMLANPLGVVIAGLAAAAYAIKTLSDNTEAALRIEREKINLTRDLAKFHEQTNKVVAKYNELLAEYPKLSQEERAEMVKNLAMKRLELESQLTQLKARERHMEMLSAEPTLWQYLWATIKNGGNGAMIGNALVKQAADNMKAVRQQFAGGIEQLQGDIKKVDDIFLKMGSYNKPAGATGLRTIEDDTEKKQKKDKAVSDAKQDADDLERMLSDARRDALKSEETDYEKSVMAFAAKYTKMYELAKGNQAKIQEIERLSRVEMAAIDKARQEKEAAEMQKKLDKSNREAFGNTMDVADQRHSDAISGIERTQAMSPSAIGDAEVHMQKLQADQQYLTQKLLLEETFAQHSADTQRQLTENWNEQVKLRADTEHGYAEQMKQAEWALQDAKRAAMTQGLDVLKTFLGKGTLAYKAAIVAQKAYAIAQLIVDNQREVAQIYANPTWSLMPDGGLSLKTAAATASRIRMGIGIAAVAAQGIQEIAAKKDGGYTDMQTMYGSPSGFVRDPTLFNLGRRSFIAGEAGTEFVINNKALSDPVIGNFARMLDGVQKSGNYTSFSAMLSGASGGSTSAGNAGGGMTAEMGLMIIRELQANRAMMEQYANRPIEQNYRLTEQFDENIQEVRKANTL